MLEDTDQEEARGALLWLRRIAIVLVGIELGWLILGNVFLHSPVGPWTINRRPERWSVAWESAWTPYPGRVVVSGFTYRQHTRKWDIRIDAGDVSGNIRVLPLLGRRFRVDGIESSSLRVAVSRREIPAPASTKTKPGWWVELRDIAISSVDEVEIEGVPIGGGTATVSGTLESRVRGNLEVRGAALSWQGARIQLPGEETSARELSVVFRGGFSPFNPKVEKGWKSLAHISGTFDVDGHVRSLAPLVALFSQAGWIDALDGSGEISAHLVLDEGTLEPETKLDVDAEHLELRFMDFEAGGSGRVTGQVPVDGARDTTLQLVLDDFHFGRIGEPKPLARGEGLRLSVAAPELRMGSPVKDGVVVLDIPTSEVADIAVLGDWLPESLGLRLEKGRADMDARLEMRDEGEEASGHFRVHGDNLSGAFRNLEFRLDLEASMNLSGKNLNDLEIDLEGSRIEFSDGVFRDEGVSVEDGWWMTVEIPAGYAKLRKPLTVEADVDLAMRDSRAVVALVAEVKSWLKYVRGLLTVHDVTGGANARVRKKQLLLSNVSLSGDRFEAEGEAEIEKGDRSGLFWVRYRRITIAVERVGETNDWKLVGSREWFDERREARRRSAVSRKGEQ
jgi:hypothetical protein